MLCITYIHIHTYICDYRALPIFLPCMHVVEPSLDARLITAWCIDGVVDKEYEGGEAKRHVKEQVARLSWVIL
jgi:hypothetical protein